MDSNGQSPPISDLYVYYCSGQIDPGMTAATRDFIGNWEEDGFSFLFYTRPARETVDKLLSGQSQITLLDEYHISYAEWLGGQPGVAQIGGFTVCPPWDKPIEDDRRLIVLDPGVVFGTGTHPTTRDCLAAIETIYAFESPRTVIDLGTGTGLLALAAAKLGGRRILAVDNNFLAARTAARNIRLNCMQHAIVSVKARAEQVVWQPADLLIANIHYDVMQRLITEENLSGKKWFVLSGLLRSQAADLERRLARLGTELLRRWECEGTWYTFMGCVGHQRSRIHPEGGI